MISICMMTFQTTFLKLGLHLPGASELRLPLQPTEAAITVIDNLAHDYTHTSRFSVMYLIVRQYEARYNTTSL